MKDGGNDVGRGALARRPAPPGEASVAERGAPRLAKQTLTPLYERLPRGPHQLGARAVAENQRRRMHGAMIEAVAATGYGRTSVKQVVTLAGVSRRAFYEQFANKQECFLATLDLIATQTLTQIAASYRASEGTIDRRLHAAFARYAEIISANPKGSRVMLVDAPSAGPAGWARLTHTLTTFERRLADSFASAPDAAALPEPVARAIVGGLRRATFVRLLEDRAEQLPALAEHMLTWTLVFHTDTPHTFARRPRAVPTEARLRGEDERARLLGSALELATLEGYANLTPMRIADGAGVSIDVFFDLFDDIEACLLAAVRQLGEEVHEVLDDPGLTGPQWPQGVRRALDALMLYFAARPANAHTIATGVFAMGQRAIDIGAELAGEVAERLTAGAPGPPLTLLAKEGIEGAIWHAIDTQTARAGTGSLPELSDYLAYVVLAPYLGADEAARIVTEERPARAA